MDFHNRLKFYEPLLHQYFSPKAAKQRQDNIKAESVEQTINSEDFFISLGAFFQKSYWAAATLRQTEAKQYCAMIVKKNKRLRSSTDLIGALLSFEEQNPNIIQVSSANNIIVNFDDARSYLNIALQERASYILFARTYGLNTDIQARIQNRLAKYASKRNS
jgi:hypothetical protein